MSGLDPEESSFHAEKLERIRRLSETTEGLKQESVTKSDLHLEG